MCHGEFPEDFLSDKGNAGLYEKCLMAFGVLNDKAYFNSPTSDDEFTRMGMHVASRMASSLSLSHIGISYLGFRQPGIRQAIYNAAARGSRRIVCVGASGLMVPGHGPTLHVPAMLKNVLRDNPALELILVPSGLEADEAAGLIKSSLGHVFGGPADMGKMQPEQGADLDETGVLLVCAHEYGDISAGGDLACNKFASAASILSGLSKKAYAEGGKSVSTRFMHDAASSLRSQGLPAVEAGFVDFALPDIVEAGKNLLDSGVTQIIAMGMPSLLHRHTFSLAGPSTAIEQLRLAFPDTNIVYVKPDPEPIARVLAGILVKKVLEADINGIRLNKYLRDP